MERSTQRWVAVLKTEAVFVMGMTGFDSLALRQI